MSFQYLYNVSHQLSAVSCQYSSCTPGLHGLCTNIHYICSSCTLIFSLFLVDSTNSNEKLSFFLFWLASQHSIVACPFTFRAHSHGKVVNYCLLWMCPFKGSNAMSFRNLHHTVVRLVLASWKIFTLILVIFIWVKTVRSQHLLFLNTSYIVGTLSTMSIPHLVTLQNVLILGFAFPLLIHWYWHHGASLIIKILFSQLFTCTEPVFYPCQNHTCLKTPSFLEYIWIVEESLITVQNFNHCECVFFL